MTLPSANSSNLTLEPEVGIVAKHGAWGKLGEGGRLQSLSLGSSLEVADASFLYKEPHNSQSVSTVTLITLCRISSVKNIKQEIKYILYTLYILLYVHAVFHLNKLNLFFSIRQVFLTHCHIWQCSCCLESSF